MILPLIVLRRLDLVLAPTRDKVLESLKTFKAKDLKDKALEKVHSHVTVGAGRTQPLYNTSKFTFEKLPGDPANIASNLVAYIHGFLPRARDIFGKFETEIHMLDESDRLYLIIKEICASNIDLSPKRISNLQMGYLLEELVRKFNEQANEEAGDQFTPREVIRLMVNQVFTDETNVFKKGIYKNIYDPTADTGGMPSVSEEFIKSQNPDARIEPFGQEYNPEIVPLPANIKLPLPLGYDNETGHDKLLKLVKAHCEDYLKREVLSHVPDAWIDHGKTKVGYEIPRNRHFYVYQPPRDLKEIEADIKTLESEIMTMLLEVV